MKPLVLTALLFVALTPPAFADSKGAAKAAFHDGTRQYEIGDFAAALAAFKRAYLAYEDPAFLFNIAQCHRMLGEKPEALRQYRMYLRKFPQSANSAEVQRIIADLQVAVDAEQRG